MSINYAPLWESEKIFLPYFNPKLRSDAIANINHVKNTETTFETTDQCLNFILPRSEFSGAYMPKDYQFRRLVKSYFETRQIHEPVEIIRRLKERLDETGIGDDMLYPLRLVFKNCRLDCPQRGFLESLKMGKDITIYTQGKRLYISGKDAHSVEEAIGTGNKTRKVKCTYPSIGRGTSFAVLNYEITGRLGISLIEMGRILEKNPRLKKYLHRGNFMGGKRVVKKNELNNFMKDIRKTETYLSLLNKRGENVSPPSA